MRAALAAALLSLARFAGPAPCGAASAASAATAAAPAATNDLPNVVFILADDVGYGDIGAYGGRVPTPHIDRLAREGMRFTDAHAPAALCAPSRFSLLTGSNPYRNGRPGGSWNLDFSCGFHAGAEHVAAGRHLTVAEIMGRAGYRSAFLGKMHLGGTAYDSTGNEIRTERDIARMDLSRGIDHFPHQHGFDYALGLPSGIQHEPFAWFENGKFKPVDPRDPPDNRSTRMWKNGSYTVGDNGTSEIVEHAERPGIGDRRYDSSQVGIVLADSAVGFIDRHLKANAQSGGNRPFLLYYSSQAIHVPHTPPKRFGRGSGAPRVAGTTGAATSDMLVDLDLQVGAILRKLDEAGIAGRTLVFFASDNGALWPNVAHYGDSLHDNNGPFRDYKASVYEGGHRVPFIVRWGDGTPRGSRIAPGTVSDELVLCQDWVATMYELTRQDMEPDQAMDSATLLPLLTGRQAKGTPVHEFVIYQAGYAYDGAIRRGRHVLVVDRNNQATELYDLTADRGQERNLIADPAHAARVAEMRSRFLAHNDHDDRTREPRTTTAFAAPKRTTAPR
jgi:arylsulfatase A-like enzyme